ncbi:hypothetical protein R5R35_000244 [Gryllus longicercus]|uniref:TIR domain-containing protein n=1 Tax=Gryllus longicercus TaxID=2509291 RepID=A0AAN9Z9W0_9ORTH
MSLATTFLGGLDSESLAEAVRMRGGERWEDPVVFAHHLPSLRSLDISGNGITSLADENFLRVPNLHHIDLSYNQLHTTPRGLRLLQQLRTLNLSYNPIVQIGHNFAILLHSFPLLKELKISGIRLEKLDYLLPDQATEDNITANFRAFNTHWYSRLEVLDASGCNLSSAESRLWARAGSLRSLRLAANPVASVPPWLAQRLPALQELDLSGCLLRLAPAQRLRRLLLARNRLATPRGALAAGEGAGGGAAYLDVSGNPLRGEWGAGAFEPLGARAAVNLSRAHLTALSPQILRSLEPLAQVDLGGNPLDCSSCAILPLREWLRNGSTPEVLTLGQRVQLPCETPPEDRGRPVRDADGPPPSDCAAVRGWRFELMAVATALVLLVASALALLAFRFRLHVTYVLHVLRANRHLKGRPEQRGLKYEFDAFVCYSKHDRMWVLEKLLPQLEGGHPPYRLCLHERDFPLGSLVVQNIVECMERSRHTLMVLTPSFVDSQWCQWELEMATHRLLEGAGRDFLVLVELQRLEARALPRLLRLLVETRTFLQWPAAGGRGGCAGGAEEGAWRRLRGALGPPLS